LLATTNATTTQSVPNPGPQGNGVLLSEASKRDAPWDKHKAEADAVAMLYAMLVGLVDSPWFARLAERVVECSRWLEFALHPDRGTGEVRFRLKSARFCRVHWCPICQWRRSLMWAAKLIEFLKRPEFKAQKGRWIMLTLTVSTVPIGELRSTIDLMNKAWKRMIERKAWPALGFLRSTEITRRPNDYVHPHFHVLMLVPTSYFNRKYLSQKAWIALWKQALRVDYDPGAHVKVFKSKMVADPETGEMIELAPIEGIKYPVKPADLIKGGTKKDADWLAELTRQTHNKRFLATGGLLKDLLLDEETDEDLLRPNGDNVKDELEELERWSFLWFHRRYRRRSSKYAAG
jgi:plasmid rolling circle replication initiator protein Rep